MFMDDTAKTINQTRGHSGGHVFTYLWDGKGRVIAETEWAESALIRDSKMFAAVRAPASRGSPRVVPRQNPSRRPPSEREIFIPVLT